MIYDTWLRVLPKLAGTAKDLKKLIERSTFCNSTGPQGPSGGDHTLMATLMAEATNNHDKYKRDHTVLGPDNPDFLPFSFENLP